MEAAVPLPIAAPPKKCPARLLSFNGRWFPCTVEHHNSGTLWISNAAEVIIGGMSGSPIIADDGSAIGVICTSSDGGEVATHTAPAGRIPFE